MGVSFRPALTFSHTPARSPLAPESSREPNLALLRSPPLPCLSYPLWLYIEPPPPPPASRFSAEAQSECFVIIPPHTPSFPPPNFPSSYPSLLASSSRTPSPSSHRPSLPQGVAADTLATTYTPRISALGIPSAPCARVRMRFVVEGASFRRACANMRMTMQEGAKAHGARAKVHTCTRVSIRKHFFHSRLMIFFFSFSARYGT